MNLKNLNLKNSNTMNAQVITEQKTRVFKHFSNGWTAETIQTINGVTWEISTLKRYGGKVAPTAQECKVKKEGEMVCTSFEMFGSKNITLISEAIRCTENAVKEQHYKH